MVEAPPSTTALRVPMYMGTEALPCDEVVVGAAGPSQAPVAGSDHHGEVESYDQIVEEQVIHRSSS